MKIKVVSLNVWEGGRLFAEALDFIKREDADILFLQEVYDGKDTNLDERFRTMDVLTGNLEYRYRYFAAEFIDNRAEGKIPQGNAVFTKFPITESSVLFFDRPLDENYVDAPENFPTISRNLICATLDTPTGIIHTFNFHGVWDLDGDNFSDARKNMRDVLLKTVSGKERVILAGDTNAKPTNPAMSALEAELTSVFGHQYPTSFNMKRKDNPGYATAMVDMMFVSNDITVLHKEVPAVDVSDHLPLIAELEL